MLVRDDSFVYLYPHPAISRWISNYTITFPKSCTMSDSYTILPDGSATLVFTCGGGSTCGQLFGPLDKPIQVGREANFAELLFIVEFRPGGYYAFSGIPQKEMTSFILPFDDVNPTLYRLIKLCLEESRSASSFIADVDRLFMAHLKTDAFQQGFSQANQMIIQSGGLISIKELSDGVFYSERHLNRLFDEYVGVSTKSFSRLVRVNKALMLMRRPSLGILQICLETGYYDMPHFVRDFKSMCGVTPQEYRNSMSDFYNAIAKF